MTTPRVLAIGILASSLALVSVEARAAMCDSLVLGNGDHDVVIGEAGTVECFGGAGCFMSTYSPRRLGACWREAGGPWQFELLTCGENTSADDYLLLSTNGGDDRVSFLNIENVNSFAGFNWCTGNHVLSEAEPIGPAAFQFYTLAYLGAGEDLYHGSERNDIVYTNAPQFSLGGSSMPADNAVDKICANEGNDILYGDLDDDWATFEDYLDGGPGSDWCDGDYWANGTDDSDLYRSCETHYDALDDAIFGTPGIIDCDADDDPFHEW